MKWNKWTIGLLLVVAGGGYYWYSSRQVVPVALQYITAPAVKGMITSSISGSGNVIVDQLATVDPTITGTVAGLSVKGGDPVKKGQSLFTIVNDQLTVDVAKAGVSNLQVQNAVDSALLSKKQAVSDYNKAKKKDKTDPTAYTKEELTILKQKIDIADQTINFAEQNVSASALSYAQTVSDAKKRQVTSPINGTVNEINIKNGDDLSKISSGNTKVSPMIIGDFNTLKASVKVNEIDIAKISIGQKAMVKFTALDDLSVSGKVEKIDSLGTVTQGVVMYTVVIGFDTIDPRIKSSMSVSASIISDSKQDVLIVPNSALKNDAQGSYVEVLVDGISQQKTVQTGIANATNTEIVSGISAGDAVVTQTIDPTAVKSTTPSSGGGSGVRIPGLSGGGGGGRG